MTASIDFFSFLWMLGGAFAVLFSVCYFAGRRARA